MVGVSIPMSNRTHLSRIVFTQDVGEHLRGLLDGSLKLETEEEKAAKEAAAETAVRLDKAKREEEPSRFKTSGFKSSFKPMGAASTAPPAPPAPADDDVDGEPIQVDNENLDGEAIDDVDGEAMDEDFDGEAIDEDVDGEAMA
jgi:U2-associated protein SR140